MPSIEELKSVMNDSNLRHKPGTLLLAHTINRWWPLLIAEIEASRNLDNAIKEIGFNDETDEAVNRLDKLEVALADARKALEDAP